MVKFFKICFAVALCGIMPSLCYAGAAGFSLRKCRDEARENPPEVEIVYNYGKLNFDHSLSEAQLNEKVRAMYPDKITHTINGLTELSPYIVVESSIVQSEITSYLCYYPKKVLVKVGYEPIVYIRNNLKKGTCRYDITMRHEQTHLDIGDLAMTEFLQKIKLLFPRMVRDIGVIVKPYAENVSAHENSSELNNLYRQKLSRMFDVFVKDMIKQQMLIDTNESYKAEGKLCPLD